MSLGACAVLQTPARGRDDDEEPPPLASDEDTSTVSRGGSGPGRRENFPACSSAPLFTLALRWAALG